MTEVRPATTADLGGVATIYDQQVFHGIATFDLEPPPVTVWERRVGSAAPGDHFLVADDDGEIAGFAYSSAYRDRPGYRMTRETSVYLPESARGQGLGRRLYDNLLGRVRDDGIHVVLGVVALPNPASVALHVACGFRHVGTLSQVGWKFDSWIDTAWYQKFL